jgi:hypothetical protein
MGARGVTLCKQKIAFRYWQPECGVTVASE